MSRTWVLVKREFVAFTHSKGFVIGTLFGPLAVVAFLVLPAVFGRMTGDETVRVAVVDPSGTGLGTRVAERLAQMGDDDLGLRATVATPEPGAVDRALAAAREDLRAGRLDGVLVLPADPVTDERAVYETADRAGRRERLAIQGAVEGAVRQARLRAAGIDPSDLSRAMAEVPVAVRDAEPGADGRRAPPEMAIVFANMLLYLVVLLYGVSVLRGVREEKDDRVVEVMLTSVRGRQLMTGKVLGIGLAGLLQVAIWTAAAALLLGFGREWIAALGGTVPSIPAIPLSAALVFLVFFLGGYFLYASLFAALGAVATSSQEAQNLQFPAMLPLVVAFILGLSVLEAPRGALAVVGSMIPFTASSVVTVRAMLGAIPWPETALAAVLLFAACAGMLWLGGLVYEVSILATGQRPGLRRLWRWVREA